MAASGIKNPELAAQFDEGELVWLRYVSPITEYYCRQIAQRDYRGKRLAYWGHITAQNVIPMLALKQVGAEIVMGACNTDSTNDAAAAYLVSKGIRVYGWQGMSQLEYELNLALVRVFEADYLCDMGGELSVAYLDKTPPVKGALEATTSGLNLLRQHKLPFPVFDWNSIPLRPAGKSVSRWGWCLACIWPRHRTGVVRETRPRDRLWASRERDRRAGTQSGSHCTCHGSEPCVPSRSAPSWV